MAPASVTLLKEAKKRGRTVTFDLIAASAETFGNRRAAPALYRLFHALD